MAVAVQAAHPDFARTEVAGWLRGTPAPRAPADALVARWLETPIGPMLAVADASAVHLLEFAERRGLRRELERLQDRHGPAAFGDGPVLDALAVQLDRHFRGVATSFDVPLAGHGTAFERTVWQALRAIPCGETRTYAEIAALAGRPSAVRAAARANGANVLALLVPCHRVIGADGSLTGYGGKLWRKAWLLDHERGVTRPAAPAA